MDLPYVVIPTYGYKHKPIVTINEVVVHWTQLYSFKKLKQWRQGSLTGPEGRHSSGGAFGQFFASSQSSLGLWKDTGAGPNLFIVSSLAHSGPSLFRSTASDRNFKDRGIFCTSIRPWGGGRSQFCKSLGPPLTKYFLESFPNWISPESLAPRVSLAGILWAGSAV